MSNKKKLAKASEKVKSLEWRAEQMALHAPYLHRMQYEMMPDHIKQRFTEMENAGRGADSEIREIDGKPAHVTTGEASLLDSLGKVLGESEETINLNTPTLSISVEGKKK